MTPNAAGETSDGTLALLSPDWYKQLNKSQLAAYIRHAYIWRTHGVATLDNPLHKKRVSRWDGGEDSFGCKFTAVWPRVVNAVLAHGADPGLWVAAHFSAVGLGKRTNTGASFDARDIAPAELCGKLSVIIYDDYCQSLPKIIAEEYQIAGRTLNLRMRGLERLKLDKHDQYLCALCDEGYVSASPFFRQGFAALAQVPEAVNRYLMPAAYDYESKQRVYDAVVTNSECKWCITEQLLNVVSGIRSQWRRFK
jgi:hypothetical protein